MHQSRNSAESSLLFAALGAFDAAVISALIWAAVTVLTKYQIGYMAIGVGALVGVSVRWFGQGRGTAYRVLSVAFSLFGCVFGNYLSQVGFYLVESGSKVLDAALSLRLSQVPAILTESFSPMDLLFYALAVLQAWKFAVLPDAPSDAAPVPEAEAPASRPFLFTYPANKALTAGLGFLVILALPAYVATHSAGTARDVYDSGSPRYEGALSWNEPHGPWRYWYEDGTLMAEAEFRRGLLEGPSTHYSEDGSISERKSWKAGFLNGPYEQYYPDGKPMSKGAYEHDRKTGLWEEYHPNGTLSASGPMLLDRRHGAWEFRAESGALVERGAFELGDPAGVWEGFAEDSALVLRREFAEGGERILYQRDGDRETVVDGEGLYVERYGDGKLAAEGAVKAGRKAGIWREWYESGKPKRVYEYEGGREYLKNYYLESGVLAVKDGEGSLSGSEGGLFEATYRGGLLEGELRTFYSPGNPMSLSTYAAGKLEGPQRTYAPDGTVLVEGNCRGGLQTGLWIWYEEDGTVSSEVEFVDGKKHGAQSFFEDGVLVKEEIYQNGVYVETRLKR